MRFCRKLRQSHKGGGMNPRRLRKKLMQDEDRIPGFNDDEAIREMRVRHAAYGRRMQEIALHALAELEKKAKAGEPLNLTAVDAKALFDAGEKIERTAVDGKEPEAPDEGTPIPPPKPN